MSAGQAIALVLDDATAASGPQSSARGWAKYATEVLDHVRLPYHVLPAPGTSTMTIGDDVRILVFSQGADVDAKTREHVTEWLRGGGALIIFGDPADLADVTGAGGAAVVDHGHVVVHQRNDLWTSVPDVPLHAVGGVRLQAAAGTDVLATWDDGTAAITLRRTGDGVAVVCGVDVWQSIVRIQQGYPVDADGTPATDGSAPIDDGILKCEDGLALSFDADRTLPPGQPAHPDGYEHVLPPASGLPMFHRPQADLWRSVVLQCLWWAADQVDVAVPWLHYWPAGVPAVAHMSHDADLNGEEHGRAALDAFAEADVTVTWCQVFPGGYQPATYTAITEAGHEHALHYNAMHDADIAQWGWPQFRAQYAWAQAVTGVEKIVSNKNHYTRWEGYTEFYEWCERVGIEIDQSRGPSKQGAVGFPFGTAHVSFPMAGADDDHRFYDVLNLPLHTQDLALAGHESVRDVILDAALEQHGVAHFLFHGPHLHQRPATRKACLALAEEARRRGMPWWTSAQINQWERRRRQVDLATRIESDGVRVTATAAEPIPGAAVLVRLPARFTSPRLLHGVGNAGTEKSGPENASVTTVRRHGRDFIQIDADLPAGTTEWLLAP